MIRLFLLAVCLGPAACLGLMVAPALAQTALPDAPAPAPPKKKFDPYASPLEVIINNKLWVTPPPARDFVKETRPDPKSLDYVPLVGKDPTRPTPRDKKGVADLRAQLEKDLAANASKGQAVTAAIAASNAPPAPAKAAAKPHKRKKAAAAAE